MTCLTPLELLIQVQDHFSLDPKDIVEVIESYNLFLEKLNDKATREELEKMNMNEIYNNEIFYKLRENADNLQNSINSLFIFKKSELTKLTLKYGIF